MNLCFICEKWDFAGDGKNLIAILCGLSDAGHSITVVLTKDERSPDGYDSLTFLPIGRHGNKVSVIREQKELLNQIMKENFFDAVLAFGYSSNLFSLCAKRSIKCPLIFCVRNSPEFVPGITPLRYTRDKLYSLADGYIFQCEEQKKHFDVKIRRKGYVIPDFIIKPSAENYADYPKEHTVLCYARLDAKQKNPYMLFDGFIDFAKSYPEYTLKLFGDGDEKEKCIEYIKNSGHEWDIKLYSIAENPEEELKKAEMFVLTSNFEGTPNELLPAMSMGTACISTDCGSAKEIIKNGVNGILIEKNNPNSLCDALTYLAENEEARKKMGSIAFEINNWCVQEKILPLWEEAIKNIIEEK